MAEADAGRILRFRAPPAPRVESPPPAFTNEGSSTLPLASPVAVVLTSISPSEVTLANATTTVNGSPAVDVPLVEGLLRPGETARVALAFQGVRHDQPLTYAREIWALRPLAVSDAEGQLSFPVTLTATATDRAGNQASTTCSIIVQNLSVRITAPLDGASLTQDRARVSGTVEGQGEIGVVVNGVLAFGTGSQWIAEVPLVLGSNDIAATATDATGAQDTRHITVQATQVQPPPVALTASPVSGLAPLTVRFEVRSGLDRPIVRYEFDQNGDGTIDLTTSTFENIEVTYATPGLLTPSLTVTDDQGRTVTATTIIQVLDLGGTVGLYQTKWKSLKMALTARDIPRATAVCRRGARPVPRGAPNPGGRPPGARHRPWRPPGPLGRGGTGRGDHRPCGGRRPADILHLLRARR